MPSLQPRTRLGKRIAASDARQRELNARRRAAGNRAPDPSDLELPSWMLLVVLAAGVVPVVLLGVIATSFELPLWVLTLGFGVVVALAIVGTRKIAKRVDSPRL